jgi:monothiol glutaredoxin
VSPFFILKDLNVDFKDINVLTDPKVRENIKIYSDWPTIPQLYVKSSFIGGCDIIKTLHSQGKLLQILNS